MQAGAETCFDFSTGFRAVQISRKDAYLGQDQKLIPLASAFYVRIA